MTTAPGPIVAPTVPPTHDYDYHPDHPGPLGRLIHALHLRMMALEVELHLRAATPATPASPTGGIPVAPATPAVTVTATVPATPAAV